MEKRRLSAVGTFFFKFGFPVIWVVMWGFAAFLIYPDVFFVPILVMGILGFLLLFACGAALKKVYLEGDKLIVSNYFKTIEIPVSEINQVKENYMVSPKLIWIHLKSPTPFGRKIKFMPIIYLKDFFCQFSSHSLVKELRELAGLRD